MLLYYQYLTKGVEVLRKFHSPFYNHKANFFISSSYIILQICVEDGCLNGLIVLVQPLSFTMNSRLPQKLSHAKTDRWLLSVYCFVQSLCTLSQKFWGECCRPFFTSLKQTLAGFKSNGNVAIVSSKYILQMIPKSMTAVCKSSDLRGWALLLYFSNLMVEFYSIHLYTSHDKKVIQTSI